MKSISMQRLAEKGEAGGVLVRLMMVLQDLAFADRARGVIAGKPSKKKKQGDVKRAAGRYYMRLQISHLFEGLKIIQEIAQDAALERMVVACNKETQKAFERLQNFESEPDYKFMERIRHTISSHYAPKPVVKSLQRLEWRRQRQVELRKAKVPDVRKPIDIVKVSLEREPYKSELVPWEIVENDIVLHDIFKLDESDTYAGDKKLDADSDEIMLRLGRVRATFGFFAGSFILKHAAT
jgi:hypothetical protein